MFLRVAANAPIDWFRASTSLIAVLVWPLLIIVLVIIFRRQLVALIQSVTEFRGPGFTAKFEREVREVGAYLDFDKLARPASASPDPADGVAAEDRVEPRQVPLSEFYARRSDENPLNALLEAYIAIERWYDRTLTDREIDNFDGVDKLSVTQMSRVAVEKGLLPASTLTLVDGLTVMRSLALTAPPDRVSPDQAREFLALADGALLSLDAELAKFGK